MYLVLQIYMQSMYGSNEAEVLIVYLKSYTKHIFL